jgi:hypothetical protein
MKTISKYFALAAIFVGLVGLARATPTLFISDGFGSILVTDGDANDSNDLANVVTFIGSIGNWNLNVTTGVSNSPLASMDLNSINGFVTGGVGTLTISFSDSGFTTLGFAAASIGGTTEGTVAYATYFHPGNVPLPFGGIPLTILGPLSGPSFSGDANSALEILQADPYALTQQVTITHDDISEVSSFDATLKVPDGGTTALLLGLGLLGTALAARRSKFI